MAQQCRRPGFDPWFGKIPLEKAIILARRIPWTEDPDRPWDSKESDTTEQLSLFHFWRDTIQPITLGGIIPNSMNSEYPPPAKDQEEGKDVCCHYCFIIEVEVLASAVRQQK